MNVTFLGEGPRDHAVIPGIVAGLLKRPVTPAFETWKRLHGGGLPRKLQFALIVAQESQRDALVATIDADDAGKDRLASLIEGRARHREKHPPLPTALGCPDPHCEAWLLDDPVAVRTVLELRAEASVPSVRETADPKGTLDDLIEASPRDIDHMASLTEIAAALDPDRCVHAKETGFARFQKEVEAELKPAAR